MAWASQESAQSKLETARETLRLSQVTYDRIAADLEQLKSSGNASPELIKNYEIYLERVGEMRDENRRILEAMEKACAVSASSQQNEPSSGLDSPGPKHDLKIPEEEGTDRVAALDRQLKESLASFDETLLKEMDKIRTASGDKMRGLARMLLRQPGESRRRKNPPLKSPPPVMRSDSLKGNRSAKTQRKHPGNRRIRIPRFKTPRQAHRPAPPAASRAKTIPPASRAGGLIPALRMTTSLRGNSEKQRKRKPTLC